MGVPKDDCCSSVAVLVVLKCDSANLESIYAVLTISGVLSDIKTKGSVDSSIYEEKDRVDGPYMCLSSFTAACPVEVTNLPDDNMAG